MKAETEEEDGQASRSALPESNTRLAQIVRRHFNIHFVSDTDPDKILAHFARNMGQYFVAVGQRHAKHCPRQYLGHGPG